MSELEQRRSDFRRNSELEDLLSKLAWSLESARRDPSPSDDYPSLFIVGAPRTGSTYCLELLAASGAFTYPSNFISRFWTAPFIGALIQDMLVKPEFNYRSELSDFQVKQVANQSDVGKTSGLLAPHEFWYYWRHHLPSDGDLGLDLSKTTAAQYKTFSAELAHFAAVAKKPVVMKGKIINHQIESFSAGVPNALFLYVDRDPIDSAWSLLQARKRIYGDASTWWSFKTPDYNALRRLGVYHQVIGQVLSIRRDVRKGLSRIEASRWLRIEYKDLCENPDTTFDAVMDLYKSHGVALNGVNSMGTSTPVTRRMPAEEYKRLESAMDYFRGEVGDHPDGLEI